MQAAGIEEEEIRMLEEEKLRQQQVIEPEVSNFLLPETIVYY